MQGRYLQARIKAMLNLRDHDKVNRKSEKEEVKETKTKVTGNQSSKIVYCYLDGKLVADYESITKCANALGMSRAMVKKAVDNAVVLDNGFLLTLNN